MIYTICADNENACAKCYENKFSHLFLKFTVYSWWSSLLSISGKVLIASDIEMFFIFYYFSFTWKKYCNWSEIIVFLGELSVNTTSSTKQLSQVILRDV